MVKMNPVNFRKTTLVAALSASLLAPAIANAFVVEKIVVEGANRIGYETINSYLPISKGQFLDSALTQQTIERLYKTGFFDNVSIYQRGQGEMVIKVEERPSIAEVKIEGNKLIETDILQDALQSLGVKQGRIYNQLDLDRIIIDLKRRYQNQGYYAASVEIESKELPRNRVDLKIKIIEGEPASMGRITLVGNEVYSDRRLKGQMSLGEGGILGTGDSYSKPKLEADLEKIRSFYLDRGYAQFNIVSSQVSLSVDKTRVFTTINMQEGDRFTLSEVKFTGETILTLDEIDQLVDVRAGDTFSRSKIINAVNTIRERLSEEGYAFAEVTPDTVINPQDKTMSVTFKVEPKNRVYIRYIDFEGNTRTRDHVIRRELRQLESAPYSLKAVRQSQSRLDRLGFFKSSKIETKRVSDDQVDLIVKIEEQPTGSFTAGIGYSQLDGASFNIGLSERNFIGSGNKLDLQVATSAARKTADIGVTDPYFTEDGVSLGMGIYYREIDAEELDVADYTTNNYGVKASIGYPLNEDDSIRFGLKLDSQELVCNSDFTYCHDYIDQYGSDTNSVQASLSWVRNTTNSFYFPSKGRKASVSLEAVVPGTSDAPFYKVFAEENLYLPMTENLSLHFKGGFAFGDGYGDIDTLPFYENFYAGGIGTVRGFEPNSLGNRFDLTQDGSDRPRGGNTRVLGTIEIISPTPFIEDSSNQRISWFFDAGYVFEDIKEVETTELRSSVGIGYSWITPVGPLTFSIAQPVNSKSDDKTQAFQFTLGTAF
ncbi:outer membrane protein assembly factor BamA [Thiomicrorhabdus xiamenensis]|uniref:Outer membrane protein assembly factor BamA n=1 Tax=Thiomicrorhabdus xiamenensis TaxID=2739063 RepID=A0A7D4NP23_9GAMM|nr:outer membrane protein assembly factor BamA [Thiomicrorhabdus xiamenensis]QKI89233.1 outer membrane protein assembly factor BamA [Thiomicrorhabdus xiamenensis]